MFEHSFASLLILIDLCHSISTKIIHLFAVCRWRKIVWWCLCFCALSNHMENCHPRKHLVRGNLVFWLLCACVPERTEHPKAHPWRIIGSYNENHISSTYFKVEMISSDQRQGHDGCQITTWVSWFSIQVDCVASGLSVHFMLLLAFFPLTPKVP